MRQSGREQHNTKEFRGKRKKVGLAAIRRAGWLTNKGDTDGLQIIFITLPSFPVALFVPICRLSLFQVSAATNTGH